MFSDYGYRIRFAKRRWEDRHDPEELSWAAISRKCLEVLRRDDPGRKLDPSTTLDWKNGVQEPKPAEYDALAEVLEAEFVWLARAKGDPPSGVPYELLLARDHPANGDDEAEDQKGA